MKESRLTERQRRFAEEKHYLLVDFLNRRRLPMDEYYDVVVFDFLDAVCRYDEDAMLKDKSFENFALECMSASVKDHLAKRKNDMRDVRMLSLDYPISDSGMTFGDIIPDTSVNFCDEICGKLSHVPKQYRLSHTIFVCPDMNRTTLMEVV